MTFKLVHLVFCGIISSKYIDEHFFFIIFRKYKWKQLDRLEKPLPDCKWGDKKKINLKSQQ